MWHPHGHIIELTSEIGTQNLGIAREARVCEVLRDGVWRFRNCRDQRIREVIQVVSSFPLSLTVSEPDGVSWKCGEDEFKKKFVSSATWHLLRGRKEEVRWNKLVWFPQSVPRYGFISWLAIKDRLATGHQHSTMGQGAGLCLLWRVGGDEGSPVFRMSLYIQTVVKRCCQSLWLRP